MDTLSRLKTLAGLGNTQVNEGTYTCVHAKKGKTEVEADSSYAAAKKAAEKWGLKSTAGIDAHKHTAEPVAFTEQEVTEASNIMGEFNDVIRDAISSAEEAGAYGDVRDETVIQAYEAFSRGDFTGAAEMILADFADQDGGEVSAIEDIYHDLVSDLKYIATKTNEAILSPEEFMKRAPKDDRRPSNMEIYSDYKEMEATGDADPYQFVLDKYPFLTPEKLDMILGDLDESVESDFGPDDPRYAPEKPRWHFSSGIYAVGSASYDDKEEVTMTDEQAEALNAKIDSVDEKTKSSIWKRIWASEDQQEFDDNIADIINGGGSQADMFGEEKITEAPTMDTTQLVNMMRNAGLSEDTITQKLEEWANTPEGVGEVEPTAHGDAYDFAQSVNLSLKKYLDAQDMKVSVNESHTGESLMEAYKAYKGEVVESEEEINESEEDGKCPSCKGTGFERRGDEKEICDDCDGSGKYADYKSRGEKKAANDKKMDESSDIERLRRLSGL